MAGGQPSAGRATHWGKAGRGVCSWGCNCDGLKNHRPHAHLFLHGPKGRPHQCCPTPCRHFPRCDRDVQPRVRPGEGVARVDLSAAAVSNDAQPCCVEFAVGLRTWPGWLHAPPRASPIWMAIRDGGSPIGRRRAPPPIQGTELCSCIDARCAPISSPGQHGSRRQARQAHVMAIGHGRGAGVLAGSRRARDFVPTSFSTGTERGRGARVRGQGRPE